MSHDVQFLADYVEICQLSARYNQLSDAADGVEYAKLFVEDGVWESGPPHARMRAQGADQLAANCAAMGVGIVHVTCDPYIEVDGDRATHTCKMIIYTGSPDKTSNDFIGTGRYTDELVRTAAGWRFKSRSAVMDKEMSAPAQA